MVQKQCACVKIAYLSLAAVGKPEVTASCRWCSLSGIHVVQQSCCYKPTGSKVEAQHQRRRYKLCCILCCRVKVQTHAKDVHSFVAMSTKARHAERHDSISKSWRCALLPCNGRQSTLCKTSYQCERAWKICTLLTTYTRALYAKQHTRVNAPGRVHSFLALHTRGRED